ncbi:MAG: vitamin K epoxide reductase family protein [Planctomycetota bacterium]
MKNGAATADPTDSSAGPPAVEIWIVRVLALVAVVLSGLLASYSTGGGVAGCDSLGGFDCSAALESRWSVWLGVPVSYVGVATYAGLLLGACLVGRRSAAVDGAGWRLLELLAPAALGAGVWFTGLQMVGYAPACLYCLAVHACGLVVAVSVAVARWRAGRNAQSAGPAAIAPIGIPATAPKQTAAALAPPSLGAPTLGGIVTVVALVMVQVIFPPQMNVIEAASLADDLSIDVPDADPPSPAPLFATASPAVSPIDADEDGYDGEGDDANPADAAAESVRRTRSTPYPRRKPNGSRIVSLLSGKLEIDTYKYPVLGSPEAEHVVVELMNYGCDHCREFHPVMEEARERYGDKLAVVVLPIANETLCNRYVRKAIPQSRGTCKLAKLAVAVATVAPEQFPRVHAYLLEGERAPDFTRATIFAKEKIDDVKLSNELRRELPLDKVKAFIELSMRLAPNRSVRMPSQICGDTVLEGAPNSVEELCEAWEKFLNITPVVASR